MTRLDEALGLGPAPRSQRNGAEGAEGRLVALHTFTSDWASREMHPRGHEVVIYSAGQITLIQESDGEEQRVLLSAGEYANPVSKAAERTPSSATFPEQREAGADCPNLARSETFGDRLGAREAPPRRREEGNVPTSATKTKTCHGTHPPLMRTGAPVASVAIQ